MHLRSIAVSAASLALRGRSLDHLEVSDASLRQCLTASRALSVAWNSADAAALDVSSPTGAALLMETLVCEIPARIAAAAAVELDRRHESLHGAPILRHVLQRTLEIKRRLVRETLNSSQPLGPLVQLDRFRRRCERWTDLLLSLLPAEADIGEFVFDRLSVDEHRKHSSPMSHHPAQQTLVLTGVRQAFPEQRVASERASAVRAYVAALQGILSIRTLPLPRRPFGDARSLRGEKPHAPRFRFPEDRPPRFGDFGG